MGFGAKELINERNYVNVKLVGSKKEEPFFVKQVEFKNTDEKTQHISGKFSGIKAKLTEGTDWGDIYGANIFIRDGDEVIVIDCTVTNTSLGMLNGILSLKPGDDVLVSCYVNKHGWASSCVKTRQEEVDAKFSMTEGALPFEEVNVEDKGKVIHKAIEKWNKEFYKPEEKKDKEDTNPIDEAGDMPF